MHGNTLTANAFNLNGFSGNIIYVCKLWITQEMTKDYTHPTEGNALTLLFANSAIILMLSYSHIQTDVNLLTANASKVKVVLMNSLTKMRIC